VASAVEQDEATATPASDVFRARMECQCQEIEEYRRTEMRDGGRVLSLDEAALEWIERYAADFADRNDFLLD